MEKQILGDIKELFQAFIAPQLEGIKGDIRALDMKIDAAERMRADRAKPVENGWFKQPLIFLTDTTPSAPG